MTGGATLHDPDSVYFAFDTRLGRDVTIGPNVVFGPGVTVGDRVTIHPFSHLEGATVAAGAVVGPFARLRPGTEVGEDAHIGNFVELKNTRMAAGAKANHLSYLGDASIGAKANIGAGTITCNYDGVLITPRSAPGRSSAPTPRWSPPSALAQARLSARAAPSPAMCPPMPLSPPAPRLPKWRGPPRASGRAVRI